AGTAQAPADLAVLTNLIGHDRAVVDEVLLLFKAISARSAAAIAQGVATGTLQEVLDAAHMLKSNARSIGALRLGDICAELESQAESGQAAGLPMLLQRFEVELAALQKFLAARVAAAEPT
ncbi:MAG: Hpt domain-containing protein, partial [Chitinophagaceae bacterium]|nr:Hpt domain-containing protein [Rubrivivax sp.]